jgi:integrase
MRLTINFLIKNSRAKENGETPVYVRITFIGKRAELSTGILIQPESWDINGQQIRGRSENAKIINNRLKQIQNEILDIYNQLNSLKADFNITTIKNKLLNIDESKGVLMVFDYYLNNMFSKLNKGYSLETYKHYKSSRKRLSEFIRIHYKRSDYSLTDINYKFLNGFDIFLKKDFDVHQNTAWNYHKHLKRVLNLAVNMEYLQKNPYSKFKVSLEETNREYLTPGELYSIEEKEIHIERLKSVCDIFIFACYTGLSYSDISKLNKNHLHTGSDSKEWIIIDRTKTKNRCRIPLLPKAKEILERYQNYPKNQHKELLLPVLTNQKMNSYLKELGDICNIKKNLTMHMARHTFATTITLNNGVPIETVSKMLGHTSLKTTQIYAKILDHKIAEDMEQLNSKLIIKSKAIQN